MILEQFPLDKMFLHEFVGAVPYYLLEWYGDFPAFLGRQWVFTTLVVIAPPLQKGITFELHANFCFTGSHAFSTCSNLGLGCPAKVADRSPSPNPEKAGKAAIEPWMGL